MGIDESALDVEDPKRIVHRALGITTFDRKDEELIELAHKMRLSIVLAGDSEAAKSLREFYGDARDFAQQNGCASFPNELETA